MQKISEQTNDQSAHLSMFRVWLVFWCSMKYEFSGYWSKLGCQNGFCMNRLIIERFGIATFIICYTYLITIFDIYRLTEQRIVKTMLRQQSWLNYWSRRRSRKGWPTLTTLLYYFLENMSVSSYPTIIKLN